MQYTLILDDLNCAHCASKIESKIAQTEGYRSVSFNFATKKLRFETDKPNPKDEIQAICDSIEDGVHVLDEHAHDHHREHHEHHGCHDDHVKRIIEMGMDHILE